MEKPVDAEKVFNHFLLEAFEQQFLQAKQVDDHSLETKDRQLIHMGKKFWKYSKKLIDESAGGENYKVRAERSTVELLRTVCLTTDTPRLTIEQFALLRSLMRELKMDSQVRRRTVELFVMSDDFKSRYLKSSASDDVTNCFEALCRTARRSGDIYEKEIKRMSDYCGNDSGTMTEVINTLKSITMHYASLGLSQLPIDFVVTSVPVAIIEEQGYRFSLVYHNEQWHTYNVLGKYFNIPYECFDLTIRYGKFALYRTPHMEVILKPLDKDEDTTVVLDHCVGLRSANGEVFARTENEGGDEIHYWVNGSFVSIHSSPYKIQDFDYLASKRLIGMTFYKRNDLVFAVVPIDDPTEYQEVQTFVGMDSFNKWFHFEDDVLLYSRSTIGLFSYHVYALRQVDRTFKLEKKYRQHSEEFFYRAGGLFFGQNPNCRTLRIRHREGAVLHNVAHLVELSLLDSL